MAALRVMVTGADGFIGSHLVARLVGEGHGVRAFCLDNGNCSAAGVTESELRSDVDARLGCDAPFVTDTVDGCVRAMSRPKPAASLPQQGKCRTVSLADKPAISPRSVPGRGPSDRVGTYQR